MIDSKVGVYNRYIAKDSGRYRGIPDHGMNVDSLFHTVQSMKEHMEIMLRQRGDTADSVVKVADLVQYDTDLQQQLAALEARIAALEAP